jgi:Na+-transporting NADH:ubiquinone oxidoreductase subunit NqrB
MLNLLYQKSIGVVMKAKVPTVLFFLYIHLIFLSSCGVVETVFKAGMWWAFFLVGLAIALILFVVFKVRGKK